MIKIICISLGMFLVIACHSTKKNMDKNVENSIILADSIYRFNVSFISIGSGIDTKAKQKFDEFIKQFNNINNLNIEPLVSKWGREGEIDYCLKLSELNNQLQDKFIADTKVLLQESSLVRYNENHVCKTKHKRTIR